MTFAGIYVATISQTKALKTKLETDQWRITQFVYRPDLLVITKPAASGLYTAEQVGQIVTSLGIHVISDSPWQEAEMSQAEEHSASDSIAAGSSPVPPMSEDLGAKEASRYLPIDCVKLQTDTYRG